MEAITALAAEIRGRGNQKRLSLWPFGFWDFAARGEATVGFRPQGARGPRGRWHSHWAEDLGIFGPQAGPIAVVGGDGPRPSVCTVPVSDRGTSQDDSVSDLLHLSREQT